jgi:hypothetical protein
MSDPQDTDGDLPPIVKVMLLLTVLVVLFVIGIDLLGFAGYF